MNLIFLRKKKSCLKKKGLIKLRIFTKTDTLPSLIYQNLTKLGKLKFIAVSFNFAKRKPIKEDEVYVFIVGTIVVPEITKIVSESEKEFGWEMNYTVMTEDEFIFRKKNNDPFVWRFLKQPKIMLVGAEDEFVK